MSNENTARKANQAFAANLVRLREARGWSTKDLASKAELEVGVVAAYEQGDPSAPLSDICQLAGALGVPVVELFEVQTRESI